MQSVPYVQKCRDRNVPRPKRPHQIGQTEKSCSGFCRAFYFIFVIWESYLWTTMSVHMHRLNHLMILSVYTAEIVQKVWMCNTIDSFSVCFKKSETPKCFWKNVTCVWLCFFCLLIARICIFAIMFSKEIMVEFRVMPNTDQSLVSSNSSPLCGHTNHFCLPPPLDYHVTHRHSISPRHTTASICWSMLSVRA